MTDSISTGLGTVADDTYDYLNNILTNPLFMFIMLIVILIYIFVFMSGGDSSPNISTVPVSNYGSNTLTAIIVAFLMILLMINVLQYFFGLDIVAFLRNILTGNAEVDTIIDIVNAPIQEILLKEQVFNVPGNDYVYPDAKALCSAYGARLATYSEVEDGYKNGGEWCNYGWSEGQMALFPTQKKTYDKLQKIEGHENDCGRPGINGGYIANPAIKFGVNCYGYKPKITALEEDLMANQPIYPKTLKDIAMENRVNYWKDKLSSILVSPFNNNTWSKL